MKRTSWLVGLLVLGTVPVAGWGELRADGPVEANEEGQAFGWPHWRGPTRDGMSGKRSGWSGQAWGLGDAAWRASLGEGSTSPVIWGGRLYCLGWNDGRDTLFCLDAATGEERWRRSYDSPRYGRDSLGDKGLYGGPTSTPELDPASGLLYTLSTDGVLICWDTGQGQSRADSEAAGRELWRVSLHERYDVLQRPRVRRSGHRDYGFTTSPLVWGETLIVEMGARQGTLIALDKRTGAERWTSEATEPAGHTGGPATLTVEGLPCVAVHTFEGLLVVRLDAGQEGRTLARFAWKTDFANNIASATPCGGDGVLLTSAYNQFRIARVQVRPGQAELLWETELASKVCSPLVCRGRVYWAWQQVHCLDLETGRLLWKGGRTGDPGSCIMTADQRLVVWSGRGDLTLVESADRSPQAFQQLAVRPGLLAADAWPHVALAGGRLYCKDRAGNLLCLPVLNQAAR